MVYLRRLALVENFLRPYVELHSHTLRKGLNVAEFPANNTISLSTCYIPFYLDAREDPTLSKDLMVPPRSTSNQA